MDAKNGSARQVTLIVSSAPPMRNVGLQDQQRILSHLRALLSNPACAPGSFAHAAEVLVVQGWQGHGPSAKAQRAAEQNAHFYLGANTVRLDVTQSASLSLRLESLVCGVGLLIWFVVVVSQGFSSLRGCS